MLTVGDLMTAAPRTVRSSETLLRVYDLMSDLHFRHVPVVDDRGDLIGIVSDRDLIRHALGGLDDLPITRLRGFLEYRTAESAMVTGVETAEPDEPIGDAAEKMLDNKFGCLPVVEGSRVVGILTEADFVRHVATQE